MTTPIGSAAYPANPTMPTGAPAGYTTPTKPPNPSQPTPPVPSDQIDATRSNLLELVLREVVKALVGAFVPGVESAFDQLASWAANIPILGPIISALTGIIDGDLHDLENWSQGIPTTVVDTVALNPGKFFADAANVTGLTALWVNTIQPWLTKEFGSTGLVYGIETFFNGILGVAGNPTGSSSGSLTHAAATMVASTAADAAANASSATNTAVTKALSSGSPTATSALGSVVSGIANVVSNQTGSASDPGAKPLPIPQWLADFIGNITGGVLTFWWADDGSWIHLNEPPGSSIWQKHHLGSMVASNVASNLVSHPAVAAVTTAAATALTGGSPTAQGSAAGGLLGELGNLLFGANFQHLATILPLLTFGILTVQDGHIKFQFPPHGATGSPSSSSSTSSLLSGVANLVSNSTGSTSNPGVKPLPIPQWLADFLTNITFGYLTFWWADDGSWIHGGEPIGGQIWLQHHIGPAVSNIASNLAAKAAPAVKAVSAAADKVAPTKGIGGEWASVFENLLGVFSNPSGSGAGSLASAVVALLTGGALSSGDVVSNITSTLVQAFTDAAAGSITKADADISTRFGNNTIGTLLTDIVNLLANPSGATAGSVPQGIWQAVWKFINCNGLTGKGFAAGNNLTGVADNPTGSSIGSLIGYVTDLSTTLFSNGGHGLSQLGALAQAIFTGNFLALIGDLFNGTFATASKVLTDVTGIVNFFANPILPSPTALTTGSQSVAAAVVGSAASALGLGDTTGGLSATVSNVMSDFMGTLGNPDGLGTGNVALNPLDNIPILGPLLEALFSGLGGSGTASHTGLLGLLDSIPLIGPLIEQLPALLAGVIGPGSSPSLLADSNFSKPFGADIQGQGNWTWAWPGKDGGSWGGPGCVRTVRNGLITVYFVPGTWEVLPGKTSLLGFQSGGPLQQDPLRFLKSLASSIGERDNLDPGDSRIDWSRFELVVVPYGGATYPMGETEAQGVSALSTMIDAIPGKFVLIGHSQGGAVVSDVYDSLRTGAMQARNDDLLMGIGIGNMRRQKGTGLPGGPVYCPTGEGCFKPLQNTETRWWEWAVSAGTYPGNGQLDGVTYSASDPVSCLGVDATSEQVRQIISQTMAATGINIFNMVEEVFALLTTPGGKALMAGLGAETPHNASPYEVQPFLSQGDTRTFWEYMLDSINALATAPAPPGERHQLESREITVAPGSIVTVGAYTEWMNVSCSGPAIMVGVNCYDSDGNLIATPSSFRDKNGNLVVSMVSRSTTVSNPTANSAAWLALTDRFVIPAQTKVATLVFDVEPDAMTTGIVAFDDATFQITNGTIDSAQLGNIDNHPSLPPTNVGGIQNIENSLLTTKTTMDGLASAFTGTSLTDVAFADLFGAASNLATAASTSLKALPGIDSRLIALEGALGIPSPPIYQGPQQTEWKTPGTRTYTIPSWMVSGDKLDVAVLGAGAGGKADNGGTPGTWAGHTLTYGTDIPLSTTHLTVLVGAAGGAVSVFPFIFPGDFSATGNGSASSVSGTGMTTITGAGGLVGSSGNTAGIGPGTFNLNGKTYFGGPTVAPGAPGGKPGGGGGAAAGTMPGDEAAPGADGYASIIAYRGS